jgi:hypothetical protein
MLCSTSRCRAVALFAFILLAGTVSGARAEDWQWRPWVALASGYESDRVLDPTLDRLTVPGGGFLDLTPGLSLSRRIGGRTRLELTGQGTFEQFVNDQSRSLFGSAATGDLRGILGGPAQWRVTVGGNYFADSELETVERFGGGGEAALRLAGARGFVEALGGGEARRYANLDVYNADGVLGKYTEVSAVAGAAAGLRVTRDLAVTAKATRQVTDARDPFYDATALFVQAGAQLRAGGLGLLSVAGLYEERDFDERDSSVDSDSYWQVGAALERHLGAGVTLSARYAFARYEQPTAPDQDTHRVSVGVTWSFGPPALSLLPDGATAAESAAPREDDAIRFRLHAPEAQSVSLVGDFNGWDPAANPLRRAGGGWWEAEVRLPAGTYQYAYLVDGAAVTPPEADVTVDDGFGGRNGLLDVAPKNL